jgi:thymidylate synthase (FAD)
MKVERLDYSGDLLVVNAARASLDKEHDRFDWESDQRLLNYLAKEGHISPFFHPHLSLRITAPIFIARQLMRSTVGLSISEVSRRYVSTPPAYWRPETWRIAAEHVKQGSGGAMCGWREKAVKGLYRIVLAVCDTAYRLSLNMGLCPEQARAMLPTSTETTWVWTGSLYAFWRVYQLRSDAHAQQEAQFIAHQIETECLQQFPHSWTALKRAAQ